MLISYLKDFLSLFIPRKCFCCGFSLNKQESYICTKCLSEFPKTTFYNKSNDLVSQSFWGRIDVDYAFSTYLFEKASKLQNVIHQIKYQGAKELAYEMGKQMAFELIDTEFHERADVVCPVPLHPQKEKKRGYNQSDYIARGFADVLDLEYDKDLLVRNTYTDTQTQKNREERWENVKEAFSVNACYNELDKHVVVIDDVLTTGATLEACCSKVKSYPNSQVSIVTLAYSGGSY